LPFKGPTSLMEKKFSQFKNAYGDNIFEQKKSIETWIVNDAEINQKYANDHKLLGASQNLEKNWNSMVAGLGVKNDGRILVDHYLMNFLPAIKKIKLDIMMQRKDKDGEKVPDHLSRIMMDKNIHAADYNSL
jgi:hypothetical protein